MNAGQNIRGYFSLGIVKAPFSEGFTCFKINEPKHDAGGSKVCGNAVDGRSLSWFFKGCDYPSP